MMFLCRIYATYKWFDLPLRVNFFQSILGTCIHTFSGNTWPLSRPLILNVTRVSLGFFLHIVIHEHPLVRIRDLSKVASSSWLYIMATFATPRFLQVSLKVGTILVAWVFDTRRAYAFPNKVSYALDRLPEAEEALSHSTENPRLISNKYVLRNLTISSGECRNLRLVNFIFSKYFWA